MTAVHVLASLRAFCAVCGGEGEVVLEKHFIEELDLPTPLKVICPHCGDPRFPIHNYYPPRPS